MSTARTRFFVWLVAGLVPGCSFFNPSSSDGGASGGGAYGYGKPTLQLTIDGVQFGPSVPDVGSGGDVSRTLDPTTGSVTDTVLRLTMSSAATGAACNFSLERFGQGLPPWRAAGYSIAAGGVGATADGQASPIAGESVSVPQGSWSCSGSTCEGAVLVLSYLAADHVEGYLSGTFDSATGSGASSVVCSFYLPMRSYDN
jgi:hypothetical protein